MYGSMIMNDVDDMQKILDQAMKALDVFNTTGKRSQFIAVEDQINTFIDRNFSPEEKSKLAIEKAKMLREDVEDDI
jgi:hypothetical protein